MKVNSKESSQRQTDQRDNRKKLKMNYHKQYSWAYEPTYDIEALFSKLVSENEKLKTTIREVSLEKDKKIQEQ